MSRDENDSGSSHVARTGHFWWRRDFAKKCLDAIEAGNQSVLIDEYSKLDRAFDKAQRMTDEWRSTEEVFACLQEVGIIGIGGPADAVSKVHDGLGQNRAERGADTFLYVAGFIRDAMSFASSLRELIRNVARLIRREITAAGYVFNDAAFDVRIVTDHKIPTESQDPYFYNSTLAVGPPQPTIPGRGRVLDPTTEVEHECVAMTPWVTENIRGSMGTFGTMVVDHPRWPVVPGLFSGAGLGWGAPYGDPGRVLIQEAGPWKTAKDVWDRWEDQPRKESHWRSAAGAGLILTTRVEDVRIDRFGFFFRDMPLSPLPVPPS